MDTLKEFDVHFVVGEKSEACHVFSESLALDSHGSRQTRAGLVGQPKYGRLDRGKHANLSC